MTELHASRTLVKSPPELWAECSDAASLARHLGRFGEIRITRLDPETAVAWEGEHARGTVRIEPAGWGTKVILTATAVARPIEEPAAAAGPVEEPVPVAGPVGEPVPTGGPVGEPVTPEAPVNEPPAAGGPVLPPAWVGSPPRRRLFARLRAFLRGPQHGSVTAAMGPTEPETVAVGPTEPKTVAIGPTETEAVAMGPTEPETAAMDPPEVEPVVTDPSEPETTPELTAAPPASALPDTEAALAAALDSLGQAHHRPYSRA